MMSESFFFLSAAPAPTEICTLSLHDALPILIAGMLLPPLLLAFPHPLAILGVRRQLLVVIKARRDRKSTRLNSSHRCISYAVFCLKKKITASYDYSYLALPYVFLHASIKLYR